MNVNFVGREAKERVRRGHIALFIDLAVKSMQIAVGWRFTLTRPAQSISERNIGPKGGPSDRLCCGWAPTCWRRPITCERSRSASKKCALRARSHTNRCVSMQRRLLACCYGIQHPGSDKTTACQVRRQPPVQRPGLRSPLIESLPH